ncbi:MAG TPA: 30S ribosomal protein S26e [Candidatus Lokiarchaeia archaeon]
MPKKRKSGGSTGSNKGNYAKIQCTNCGRLVARSKAKAITNRTSLVDARMFGELKKTGTIILSGQNTKYYCISCAIHFGAISQREKSLRKTTQT